jgi:hypothetical protein
LAVPKVNFDSFVVGAYPKSGAKGGDAVTQEETIWTWLGAIFTGVDELREDRVACIILIDF